MSILDASSHLYNRDCPSIRPSVGDTFVKNKENPYFQANDCRRKYTRQISCNHIIIESFNHHEDASSAISALFKRLERPCICLVQSGLPFLSKFASGDDRDDRRVWAKAAG